MYRGLVDIRLTISTNAELTLNSTLHDFNCHHEESNSLTTNTPNDNPVFSHRATRTIFERGERGNPTLSPIAAKLQEAGYDRVRDVVAAAVLESFQMRVRAIRRDLVQPLCDKKYEAKLAVLEAALAAPKLPVKSFSAACFGHNGNNHHHRNSNGYGNGR
ncbi:hypothetical protein DKX38_022102 [Salix brachista]|uniref:Uncharacterized protein n=1 Tax=Salix brachista TaxID=2182728 RepID=A0A5N5K3G1_9ROSI|nr:hypothetical protein DKX38_022102 [Salix brachista]